jgi:hypothetical protein
MTGKGVIVVAASDRAFFNWTYPIIGGCLVLGSIAAVVVIGTTSGASHVSAGALSGLLSLLGLTGWFCYIRPRVVLRGDCVEIRNPSTSYRIPGTQIASIKATDRLEIELGDGQHIRSWAVQRANLSGVLGREGYVDHVASELSRALAGQGGEERDLVRTRAYSPVALCAVPLVYAIIGALIGVLSG